jgi:NAD(P)-dependent dehydrogenase (short-subunit alcohol dehydrogenase family)
MTHLDEQAERTTLVVGASRGLGRGIAAAVAAAGIPVVAVARTPSALRELESIEAIRTEVADARDPASAGTLQRFIAAYAQDESDRAGLDISFTAVLPRVTPLTNLGRPAVQAYAARNGQTQEQYLAPFGAPLTPKRAGDALVELLRTNADDLLPEYLLSATGLQALPRHASPPAAAPPTEQPIRIRARA